MLFYIFLYPDTFVYGLLQSFFGWVCWAASVNLLIGMWEVLLFESLDGDFLPCLSPNFDCGLAYVGLPLPCFAYLTE